MDRKNARKEKEKKDRIKIKEKIKKVTIYLV